MNYNEYIRRAYDTACKHGFHDKSQPKNHWLMMVITEVAEVVEADRKEKHAMVSMFKKEAFSKQPKENRMKHWLYCFELFIKDTFEDEMADVCIRLFDLAGVLGYQYYPYNKEIFPDAYLQTFRNQAVTEKAFDLCRLLTRINTTTETRFQQAIFYLVSWAKSEGIDLEWHIEQKMEFNGQRVKMHGKKY